MAETPLLISLCVVTYKSDPFIVETLESIKAQTYAPIELIVSDDCSPDDTVDICRRWLSANSQRFVRTQLVTSEVNTGVSANANRAFRAARGQWLKILAGDDKLMPNCIDDNVRYVMAHPGVEVVFSNLQTFGEVATAETLDYTRYFTRLSPVEFCRWQMVYNSFPAPSSLMSRIVYERLGGFEETIPFMEDKPFWVKALHHRVPMGCFAGPTVAYRIHGGSLVHSKRERAAWLVDSDRQAARFFIRYMYLEGWLFGVFGRCLYAKELHAGLVGRLVYALRLLNPYYYYLKRLKRRLQ